MGSLERINDWAKLREARDSQAISGLDSRELPRLLRSTQYRHDSIWALGQIGVTVGIIGAIVQYVNGNDLVAVCDLVSIGASVASAWVNDIRIQPRIDLINRELRIRNQRPMAVLNYHS